MFIYNTKCKYYLFNLFLVTLLVFLFIIPALAQTAPDAGSTIQQIEQNKAQLAREKEDDTVIPEMPLLNAPSGNGEKFELKGFKFTGGIIVPEIKLQQIVQSKVGEKLTLNELNKLVLEITSYLRKQGYVIAFAYLPVQEVEEGIIEISIIPGKYGEVRLENQSHISIKRLEKMTGLLQPGDVVTSKELERTLLLLNDLAGMEIKSTLTPGKESGTTDLIIRTGDSAKSNGTVTVDNWGNKYTGSIVYGTQWRYNHLRSRGDYLDLAVQTTGTGLQNINLGYNIPLGYQGLDLDFDYSTSNYVLGEEFSGLDASGESEIIGFKLKYPFIRSRTVNFYGITGYTRKQLEDELEKAESYTPRSSYLWEIGFFGDYSINWLAGGRTDYSLIYYNGELEIKDELAAAIDDSTYCTAGSFSKIKIRAQHRQYFNPGLNLQVSVDAQYAGSNLDSSEKMSLGGANGVRAYPQGEASGDQGYILTAELRQLLGKWSTAENRFYMSAYHEYGQVTINKEPWTKSGENERNLKDIGIALVWTHSDKYMLRIDYAHKLGEDTLSDENQDNRFWLRMVRFF